MTWRENAYQRRSPLISHLPCLLCLFFQMPLPSWGWFPVPLFPPIALLRLPWWLLHEPFRMPFATILTCPSVLFEDFSVPKLPCPGLRLLHGSTPTVSILYPFHSVFLPTLFFGGAVLGLHCCAGSSLVVANGGCSLVCGARTSDCSGFSRAPGLSSHISQALEHRLNSFVAYHFSCSKAYIEPPEKPLSYSWFFN